MAAPVHLPPVIRHVRYLLAVAEHRNFTRAAETLHVSQPTLSQQIKQLEDFVGAQLLDRAGRSVRLTDAGEVYVRCARRAILAFDEGKRAIDDVENLSRGQLRIGMTPPFTFFMAGPLLNRFGALYPGIRLTAQELTQNLIEAELAEDLIDIGIVFNDAISAAAARADEFEIQNLGVQPLKIIVAKAHPLAARVTPLSIADFKQIELALLPPNYALRRHVDLYCDEIGVEPNVAFESNSVTLLIEVVCGGRLATIFAEDVIRRRADLSAITLTPALPERTIVLLRKRATYQSAACRAFVKLIANWSLE